MIEHRHLRYFVAVAEERHFGRAAKRLNMAQPPLSAAIRQLEQELAVELLRRTSREVALTEAGRAFLDGAHRTLSSLERAVADARCDAAGAPRHLRVAFGCPTQLETFPAVCEAFRASRTGVSVLAEQMRNAQMPEALRRGAVDVAVACCPEVDRALSSRLVRRERVIALLPRTHPLVHADALALSDLASEEFLCPPSDVAPRFNELLVGLCQAAGFDPKLSAISFRAARESGILGEIPAVSLVPESAARDVPDGVVALPLLEPLSYLETCVIWRTDNTSEAVRSFQQVAAEVFPDDALLPVGAALSAELA